MAKMKPGQVSAKRAYEISDSLMSNSNRLKKAAYPQIQIGKGAIRNKVGGKQLRADYGDIKNLGKTLSGKDRLNIGQNLLKKASADSTKSVMLKSRADAAMSKANRDYPLSESPNPTFKNQK